MLVSYGAEVGVMPHWRCEVCGEVYDTRIAVCRQCEGGIVTKQSGSDVESRNRFESVTDSEKVETFDAWGVVDWTFLALMLAALASLVFGLLQSLGGV